MSNIDLAVLDTFESFGEVSVRSGSLIAKLCDEGFDVPDIVGALYHLIDRGLLSINITGSVQRARLDT